MALTSKYSLIQIKVSSNTKNKEIHPCIMIVYEMHSKYSLVRNHVCVAQSFLITGFPYVGIRCSRENEYCINKQ